uniref:Uncharacterized protein n=1 Tax=Octopus bimaculoides TaxID=37653 RepID=A0A0L8IAX3_OCTBM
MNTSFTLQHFSVLLHHLNRYASCYDIRIQASNSIFPTSSKCVIIKMQFYLIYTKNNCQIYCKLLLHNY